MKEIKTNKREMHPEIFILLERKYAPKKIISMGYSKSTVYKYNIKYKDAVKRIAEI